MTSSTTFEVQFESDSGWEKDSSFLAALGNGAYSQALNRLNECVTNWPYDKWRLVESTTKVLTVIDPQSVSTPQTADEQIDQWEAEGGQ